MAGKRLVYWDACIFIAWLKDEQRVDPQDLDGIAYLVEEWDAGRIVIATSTITRIEVLDCTLSPQEAAQFELVLRRSTIRVEGVTSPIAGLAHSLRNHYANPRLSTPDAIHLATAIAAGCDEFYTFDGAGPNAKGCKLLSLGPTIAGIHQLRTLLPRRPVQSQAVLPGLAPIKRG